MEKYQERQGHRVWIAFNRKMVHLMGRLSDRFRNYQKLFRRNLFLSDNRSDDIFIVTHMKSGTTLLQMVVYQLMTDGNMNFRHLYEVSPWVDLVIERGAPLGKLVPPRIFKSHYNYNDFKARGKILYGIRNGMDVAVSWYMHEKCYYHPDMDWDTFYEKDFMRGGWFTHVSEWIENKKGRDVFYVRYEDLVTDMRKTVEGIAAFLNVPVSEETYCRIHERCSFGYMKANEKKFGEQPKGRVFDQFIRKGESNTGKYQFSADQKEWYNVMYKKNLAKYGLGYDLY